MKRYDLTDNLSMQKLNLETEKDLWLMRKLQSDELVCGENGYLWQESYYYRNTNYLQNEDIYDSPFSIYHYEDPIGYLEVSKIYETSKKSSVYLSYAMIKEARNHGYMRKILLSISNDILLDRVNYIDEVVLMIDSENIASQKGATYAGFICDFKKEENSFTYYKKREHLPTFLLTRVK